MTYTFMESPVGRLLLAGEGATLRLLWFAEGRHGGTPRPSWIASPEAFADVRGQLQAYFAGSRTSFDVTLDPGGTPFQSRVWQALREIPYGTTVSYSELARRLDSPRAVRAVGLANGANPISIIIPCHRVIGADGSLTGYGGGLPMKRALLSLEQGQGALI